MSYFYPTCSYQTLSAAAFDETDGLTLTMVRSCVEPPKLSTKRGVSVHHLRIGGQQRGDDVAQSDGATTVSVHFKLQAPLLKNPNNCPPSRYFSRISLRYYPCSISFPISFENNFTVGTLTHQETLFVCWAVCCLSVGWVYLLHCLELP